MRFPFLPLASSLSCSALLIFVDSNTTHLRGEREHEVAGEADSLLSSPLPSLAPSASSLLGYHPVQSIPPPLQLASSVSLPSSVSSTLAQDISKICHAFSHRLTYDRERLTRGSHVQPDVLSQRQRTVRCPVLCSKVRDREGEEENSSGEQLGSSDTQDKMLLVLPPAQRR
eukprot:730785-Hanusia_phi.AAC.4